MLVDMTDLMNQGKTKTLDYGLVENFGDVSTKTQNSHGRVQT